MRQLQEKRICYKIWHKTKIASDRNKYKEARRNARSVALALEKTRQELVNELESTTGKRRMSTAMHTRTYSKWQNPGRM